MPEYIDRENLINEFSSNGCIFVYGTNGVQGIISRIARQPAADVAPVVHGEWRESKMIYPILNKQCSECFREAPNDADGKEILYDYCPNCGAKMDGKDKKK